MIWEGVYRTGWIPDIFLSSPYLSVVGLGRLFASGKIIPHLKLTLVEVALAYGMAVSVGIGLGLLIGGIKYLREVFDPFLMGLYAIPKITIFPLFIVWVGFDIELKVLFGAFHGVFVIIITTIAGIKSVKKGYIYAALTMGMPPRRVYYRVFLPAALPSIFTGLRIGMIFTVLGVLLAELIVSRAGLGFLMNQLTFAFKTPELYGLTIAIALVSIMMNEILRYMEKRLDAWR